VPTVEAVLDSSQRPKYWSRKYDPTTGAFDSHDHDHEHDYEHDHPVRAGGPLRTSGATY
jgi:hypothetical protein